MGIIFLIVTPTGILVKLFKKDLLNLKKNSGKLIGLKKQNSSLRNQF